LTLSTTSRNTSFLRYRMPSERHDTALVTAIGGRTWTSSLCDSCVMYLRAAREAVSASSKMGRREKEYDALLQDLALGRLRVAKVHDLVEELVAACHTRTSRSALVRGSGAGQASGTDAHDDEVIPDRLLLELLEVLGQDLRASWAGSAARTRTKGHEQGGEGRTDTSLWRKVRISAAFEFFLVRATTAGGRGRAPSGVSAGSSRGAERGRDEEDARYRLLWRMWR